MNKRLAGLLLAVLLATGGVVWYAFGPKSSTQPEPAVNKVSTADNDALNPTAGPQSQNLTPPTANSKSLGGQTVVVTPDRAVFEDYAASHGLHIVSSSDLGSGRNLITLSEAADSQAIQALTRALPEAKIGKNYLYRPTLMPNDTYFNQQWALTKISTPTAWDISTGSSSTTIAVIDSGILSSQTVNLTTYTHDDFPASKIWTNSGEVGGGKEINNLDDDGNGKIDDWQGWDFMGGFRGNLGCPNFTSPVTYQDPGDPQYVLQDNDPNPYSCDNPDNQTILNKNHYNSGAIDKCGYSPGNSFLPGDGACYIGHGTMVSSVAAAATNNAKLIAGLNHNAKLMNIRVFDGYGVTSTNLVASALQYAINNGANIINLSLAVSDCSGSFSDSTIEALLTTAKSQGIVVAAAAGNEGDLSPGNVCYPGSSANVLGAGATDSNDNLAGFSNFGPELDIVAPGVQIFVDEAPSLASNNLDYDSSVSGTSFSAPHVAGLAALLKGLVPSASVNDINRFITANADKVAGMNGADRTNQYGYGRINAWRSLKYTTIVHPDGTLVKHPDGPAINLVENGQLKPISQAEIFFSQWGHVDSRVKTITPTDSGLAAGSAVSWREGTLVKDSGPAIYALENKIGAGLVKRHISSVVAYQSLGYGNNDRINVPDSSLNAITTDSEIVENDRHPYGTLVRANGQLAVYLIDAGQKRYVPHIQVLQSLNKGNFKVFVATAADMALPNGAEVSLAEGTVVRADGLPIYVIDNDDGTLKKRHILSPDVFTMLGYREVDVLNMASLQLPATNGPPID